MTVINESAMALCDLTALYHAKRQGRGTNYQHLDSALNEKFGKVLFQAFTSYSDANEGQVSFINTLESLGWNVDKVHPQDIPNESKIDYRFDSIISYECGSIVSEEEYSSLIVISDSVNLIPVLLDAANYMDVYLAFYSEFLPQRWFKSLLGKQKLKFLDLADLGS